jgi:alpha-D-xyloside xylohydrolase
MNQFARQQDTLISTMKLERSSSTIVAIVLLLGSITLSGFAQTKAAVAGSASATKVRRDARSITLETPLGVTRLEVWGERTVRVLHSPSHKLPKAASLAVIAKPGRVAWQFKSDKEHTLLVTPKLQVRVDKANGTVHFADGRGEPILNEALNGASFHPTTPGGGTNQTVQQQFELDPQESIHGLGQHPDGMMNHVGTRVHLQQENRVVGLPVLLSSKGYMVLWDNAAVTDVDVGKADQSKLTWSSEAGEVVDYYFLYGPEPDQAIAAYRALTGAAPMFPRWAWGFWQCRERYSTQQQLLDVVAEYRKRGVPLDGIIQDWQYWRPGAWGSHTFDPERYPDPTGMVDTVHRANAHIIISVWPRFDLGTTNLTELQKAGAVYATVYSNVWPKGVGKWYDPFNPAGRRIYWRQLSANLFKRGFDGWWMDASEAELGGKWGEMREVTTTAGPGAKVFNTYPLMHSTGVYQGQRSETSAKRVFILTRSAWAGQQRNAAVTWSGDTRGTWEVFRQQIPAGLNFVASGIPYWNTDIGGFFAGDPVDPKYAELFTRWFQFGAFCPMFRVHGTGKPKEIWRFDEATQKILIDYDHLRYRLLPYIYSVSWKVTNEGYTMMRPLVMDFRNDPQARGIPDQFMFGPAILVNPVTQSGATNRGVYLPSGPAWYDFWTGKVYPGGQTVEADAPVQTLPLFVKAGSIVPCGPSVQQAMEKADPITLYVYTGADGAFTLYEDDGLTYAYERGKSARILIRWNDEKRTLTIGKREGSFPSMLTERTFEIVFVTKTHPYPLQGGESSRIGIPSHGGVAAAAVVRGRGRGGFVAGTVRYRGAAMDVRLEKN